MYLIVTVNDGKLDSAQTYIDKQDYEYEVKKHVNAGWQVFKEGAVDGLTIFSAGLNDPCYQRKNGPWEKHFEQEKKEDEWHTPVLTTTPITTNT